MESVAPFRWQDGERTIRFGQGAVADGAEDFGEGYALLTTERTLATAPQLADRASQVVHVRSGRVDEIAGELLDEVGFPGAGPSGGDGVRGSELARYLCEDGGEPACEVELGARSREHSGRGFGGVVVGARDGGVVHDWLVL